MVVIVVTVVELAVAVVIAAVVVVLVLAVIVIAVVVVAAVAAAVVVVAVGLHSHQLWCPPYTVTEPEYFLFLEQNIYHKEVKILGEGWGNEHLTASVGNVQPTLKLRKIYHVAQLVSAVVSDRNAGLYGNSKKSSLKMEQSCMDNVTQILYIYLFVA